MPPAHLAGHVPCIQHLPAWETPQQAGAACQRIGHTSSPPLFADFGNNHKCLLAFLAENWGQAMQEGGGKHQEPASSLRSSPQQENAWKTVHCASPRRKPKKLAWGAVSTFMIGEVGGLQAACYECAWVHYSPSMWACVNAGLSVGVHLFGWIYSVLVSVCIAAQVMNAPIKIQPEHLSL